MLLPNPVVAVPIGENLYRLSAEVSLRETGGVDVILTAIDVEVFLLGSVPLRKRHYAADEIRSRNYPTSIAAGANLQFPVSTDRIIEREVLLRTVTAEITIRGVDARGNQVSGSTRVKVRLNL